MGLLLRIVSHFLICIDFIVNLFACEHRIPSSGSSIALEVLGIVSLVFSCMFMVELIASIWAFGAR